MIDYGSSGKIINIFLCSVVDYKRPQRNLYCATMWNYMIFLDEAYLEWEVWFISCSNN